MQADIDDLGLLLEIQQLDLQILQAKKRRAELPQRIQVMKIRKKREEVNEKLERAQGLQRRARAEFTIVEDEDRALQEKQSRAQGLIDAAGSDFRKVESHSREMAAAEKRREGLLTKIEELKAQIDKINAVCSQLESSIAASEEEEAELRRSFEAEDDSLVAAAKKYLSKRKSLCAQMPADLLDLYEKTATKAGGVGVGRLVENTCGVCRSPIEGGRLIDLKASAPLGTCPNCGRLLVIE